MVPAACLHERGWPTGGFVSAYVLRAATGMNQGFDTYDSELPPSSGELSIGQVQRDGENTLAAAEKWLTQRDAAKPFFLFFHIYEPHKPYAPPARFASYEPYDGEIAYADEIVGRLLDRLRAMDVYDRATIILLSDHGEGLGDHGEQEHGLFLYTRNDARAADRQAAGPATARRVAAPVQHIDLVPTILDLVGAPKQPAACTGVRCCRCSTAPGRSPTPASMRRRCTRAITSAGASCTALTDARYRLIRAPRDELFDLERDPKRNGVRLPPSGRRCGRPCAARSKR